MDTLNVTAETVRPVPVAVAAAIGEVMMSRTGPEPQSAAQMTTDTARRALQQSMEVRW